MFAKTGDEAFDTEIANYEPQFQRTKPAAELDAVVHAVLDGLFVACFEIFRYERERFF